MITIYRYRLPFRQPFTAPGHTWSRREGLILRYREGRHDLACEAAPLPGFSRESGKELLETVWGLREEIDRFVSGLSHPGELRKFLRKPLPPSLACAVSALSLQLLSIRNSGSFNPFGRPSAIRTIAVNGTVGMNSDEQMLGEIGRLADEGYRTVKIKSGPDPARLLSLLEKAASLYPTLVWRIDANGSWPAEEASEWLRKLARPSLQYCEEPCRFADLAGAAHFRKNSPVPIALDESLDTLDTLQSAIEAEAADLLILKPMLLGSIPELIGICSTEGGRKLGRIVTTSLESGVGRMALHRLAWLIGSRKFAHGLGTGAFFQEDLLEEGSGAAREVGPASAWCPDFSDCKRELLEPVEP